MAAITWIHLSDFHAGPKGQSVWHQVETELRPSVEAMAQRVGSPDLILFTGDLANRGLAEEYERVDALLDRVNDWVGRELPVVAVPGNHDVVRSWRHAAFKHYETEPDIQKVLWETNEPVLDNMFPHYVKWAERRVSGSLKKAGWIPHISTRVPGDLSVVVELNGLRLGLVGLNTAWTHLSDGGEGELQLPLEQFLAALPERPNPLDWFQGHDAAFLLTHHPHQWLSTKAQETYLAAIHLPSRFTLALFGHVHKARTFGVNMSGGKPRVYAQATSLFGLEHYGEAGESRVMGYSWGCLTTDGEVRVWPLARVPRGDGSHAFDRDTSFSSEDDDLGGVVLVRAHTVDTDRPKPQTRPKRAVDPPDSDHDLIDKDQFFAAVVRMTESVPIEVLISDDSTQWYWKLFPTVFRWRRNGVRVRMITTPPSGNEREFLREQTRRRNMAELGVEIIEHERIQMRAYLFSRGDASADSAVVGAYNKTDGGPIATQYTGRRHQQILRVLWDSIVSGLPQTDPEPFVPQLVPMDDDQLLQMLKKGVTQYGDSGVILSMEDVLVNQIRPLTMLTRAYKYQQITALRHAFDEAGVPLFGPAAVTLKSGGRSVVAPPVVEVHGNVWAGVEGNTRTLYCRRQTLDAMRCVVIRGVKAQLPGTTVRPEDVRLVHRDMSPAERMPGFDHDHFRRIEGAVHPLDEE